jgi:hypothetical protein
VFSEVIHDQINELDLIGTQRLPGKETCERLLGQHPFELQEVAGGHRFIGSATSGS